MFIAILLVATLQLGPGKSLKIGFIIYNLKAYLHKFAFITYSFFVSLRFATNLIQGHLTALKRGGKVNFSCSTVPLNVVI